MHVFSWFRRWSNRLTRNRIQRMPQRRSSNLRLEALEDRLTPSTGGLLDPTFGSGGIVLSSFTNKSDEANAVAVQPDGKIVIAGYTAGAASTSKHAPAPNNFLVARYNANGSLDTSFGSGGQVATDFGYQALAVALEPQANGTSKIVVAGWTSVAQKKGDPVGEIVLHQYNANGTLDTTFGTNGTVTTEVAGQSIWNIDAMAVDSSGRIVVAGNNSSNMAILVRYTPNGALDTFFGTGGVVITNIQAANIQSAQFKMVLQPDGKVVIASSPPNTNEFLTARFNANGTADSTFGNDGVVTTLFGINTIIAGVTIQDDGKIVVGGAGGNSAATAALYLLRYNADGSLDSTFGTGGTVAVLSGNALVGSGIAVQADGKIVFAGRFLDNFTASRVNPDGSVDMGYGTGGWATVPLPEGCRDFAMALEPDGRLLLAGEEQPTSLGTVDVVLVRLLGSAPQVGSFTASPNPATAGSLVTLMANSLTDGNPNSTVTQVAFYVDSNGDGVLDSGDTLLGYATQTSPGVWTYSFTVTLTPGSYTYFAQAQDNYGALGDPLAATLQVM